MNATRRTVLGALAATTALSTVRLASAQYPGLPVSHTRRDVNTLAADDPIITTYRNAVAEMQARPDGDPLSWEHQASIHNNFCPHGNWFFLPWHRCYLAQFEDVIRQVANDPEWTLPYWDWTRNPQIPAPFWGADNALSHPRSAGPATSMPSEFVGEPVIRQIMAKPTFEEFASFKSLAPYGGTDGGYGQLEQQPHNRVHGVVGGDMATFMSPRDPIFWLHHCNVDRIWASWNAAGNANTSDPVLADFTFAADQPDHLGDVHASQFVNPDGSPRIFTVNEVYATQQLMYVYDRLEPVPQTNTVIAMQSLAAQRMAAETLSANLQRSVAAGVALETAVAIEPAVVDAVANTGRIRSLAVPQNSNFAMPRQISTAKLKIRGLKAPAGPDTAFRVFINCDYVGLETPINDPHYVGSGAFFMNGVSGEGHHHQGGVDFVLDLTEALDALRRSGNGVGGQIRPQVLAITSDGKGTELAIDGAFDITVETVG
ncbi:MAG: tyrosinase family protein [Nitratireductor sp.]|nr:tyrosinase family protein [Nitratireductor sp.]